ncbi:AraC family transcriptional regulator ligand-binding domain-containing protein [Aquirhabdus sp.]|uniref:AraC family transcriptional regulator n=1 Tax=Aquirhabdus sp. TaxID=2824160 RepID=UPI00396C73A3
MTRFVDKPTIPGSYVLILMDVVSRWHVSPELLLWGSGITPSELKDIRWQVELPIYVKLLARAVELTQEPGLGFYFGMQLKVSSHGLVGFAATVTQNLREAINTLIQFFRLQSSAVQLRMDIQGAHAVLYLEEKFLDLDDESDRLAYGIAAIYLLMGCISMIKALCGVTIKPDADYRCKRPEYFSRFDSILTNMMGTLRFEQPYSRIIFPKSTLDLPLIMADSIAANILKEQCQKELDRLVSNQNIVSLVRGLIFDDVQGIRTLEEVAVQLHLSARTLQRILQDHEQSFQNLLNEVLQQKSKALLMHKDLPLDAIADKLGYANVPSFSRAFKRWFGIPPSQYRSR